MQGAKQKLRKLLVLIAATVSVYATWRFWPTQTAKTAVVETFYGKVIDSTGAGVSTAQISFGLSKFVQNKAWSGRLFSDVLETDGSVQSDSNGNFEIQIPPPANILRITSVTRAGYQWVIDHGWQTHNDQDSTQNLQYYFSGNVAATPQNHPDRTNPAVFPLQRIGDASPATRPSRGGFDVLGNRSIRINVPSQMEIPSLGSGAPTSEPEIRASIEALTRKTKR